MYSNGIFNTPVDVLYGVNPAVMLVKDDEDTDSIVLVRTYWPIKKTEILRISKRMITNISSDFLHKHNPHKTRVLTQNDEECFSYYCSYESLKRLFYFPLGFIRAALQTNVDNKNDNTSTERIA